MAGKTLYDKLWEAHEVKRRDDGSSLIYIDRHIIHEVTSPQAFEGLRLANRKPWRIDTNIATPDHNVPTTQDRQSGVASIADETSRIQVQTLDENCDEFGIVEFKMNDPRQGIVQHHEGQTAQPLELCLLLRRQHGHEQDVVHGRHLVAVGGVPEQEVELQQDAEVEHAAPQVHLEGLLLATHREVNLES